MSRFASARRISTGLAAAWLAATLTGTVAVLSLGRVSGSKLDLYDSLGVLVYCVTFAGIGTVVLGLPGLLVLFRERWSSKRAFAAMGALLGGVGVLLFGTFGFESLIRLAPVGAISGAAGALAFRYTWQHRRAAV